MLPPFAKEFTKSQIDRINKAYQTGGRLVIKPTRKQIEGGFLGTVLLEFQWQLVWYPRCLEVGFKLIMHHHQIQKMFMCRHRLHQHMVKATIHIGLHLLWELGRIQSEREFKKKSKGKGLLLGKNSPFNSVPILGAIL